MLHLASGIYDALFREVEFRVLIVGCDGSGKTTLLERLKRIYRTQKPAGEGFSLGGGVRPKGLALGAGVASAGNGASSGGVSPPPAAAPPRPALSGVTITPTIGLNVARVATCGGARLLLWDVGGRAALRPLWGSYYAPAHAVVVVVDVAAPERLAEARGVLAACFAEPALAAGCPLLLVLNKADGHPAAVVGAAARAGRENGENGANAEAAAAAVRSAVSELGILDLALQTQPYGPRAATAPVCARSANADGDDGAALPSVPPLAPVQASGTSGIGRRVFRIVPLTALYDDGAPAVKAAFEWLGDFLLHNARTVAAE